MKTKSYSVWVVLALLSMCLDAAGSTAEQAVLKSIRGMDYNSLPLDAIMHCRTKWSNDVHIFIDDESSAPSLYTFDRSGKLISGATIQIPDAHQIRIHDFAAARDNTLWVTGQALSTSGQLTFFLAHIEQGGETAQFIQTTPYRASQLAVGRDDTVWTVGVDVIVDVNGKASPPDPNQNVLRHFDVSGKLISSGVPLSTVDLLRCYRGYLVATEDRLGWYSPVNGSGTYVEFSLDMTVISSYPTPISATNRSTSWGFALTPAGNAFVMFVVARQAGEGLTPTLYKLDRTANAWKTVEGVPVSPTGVFPMLEGNDGESLVFKGPPDKSKLKIVNVTAQATP